MIGQPSARPQAVGQPAQGDFQRLQFVVHGYAEGLKCPRRRVDPLVPGPRHAAPQEFGQLG